MSNVDGTKPKCIFLAKLRSCFATILRCLMSMVPSQSASSLRSYDHILPVSEYTECEASPSVPTCLTKGSGGTRSCEVGSKGESDQREREGRAPPLWIQIKMSTKSAPGRCDLCDCDPFASHICTRKYINIENFCCRKCGFAVEERWSFKHQKLSKPSYTTCEREAKTRVFFSFSGV